MTSPDAATSGADGDLDTQRRCLAELRSEIETTYPAVSARSLLAIVRRNGLDAFPAGFLVAGSLRERGPDGARQSLAAALRGGSGHPLFSPAYYGLSHPDVARSPVPTWVHYQRFGRLEGRSPHPLIDMPTLSASLPAREGEVVDDYLGDRRAWFLDPGPYVDVGSFVASGTWSGMRHPLVELSRQLDGPWVHGRLMLVDSRSPSEALARLVAGAYLLTRGGGRGRLGTLRTFTSADDDESLHATVVPGFLLARGSTEIERTGRLAVSPDGTVVRIAGGAVALAATALPPTSSLSYVTGPLGFRELGELVRDVAARHGVVAPWDRAQEIALRQLRRDLGWPGATVLEHGVQVTLKAAEIRLVPGAPAPEPPERAWSADDARDTAVVLRASQRRRATGDPNLRALLASGAALCLIDGSGLNTWLPILQSRGEVVVERALLAEVASFVEHGALRLLPPSPGWAA